MLEFFGELHDDLGLVASGQTYIVESGEQWEGSIDLDVVPEQAFFRLEQEGQPRGSIKIDLVDQDEDGYHAHFIGIGPLKRIR